MGLVDEAISSENLLQLLEYMDKILEIYGGSRRNERVATVALYNLLLPLGKIYDPRHVDKLRNETIVIRNVNINEETYQKIFRGPPLGKQKTEFDLFFLNAPTVMGHPSESNINFYIEVEMGDVSIELQHLMRLRKYFRQLNTTIYPVLVCKGYKGWDDTSGIPCFDISDLEKISELISIRGVEDIPGLAYEWAASALKILEYIMRRQKLSIAKDVNFRDGLWNTCPELRQHDFNRFVNNGRIYSNDYEDFSSFRQRMISIIKKMHEKGLLNLDSDGNYELTVDGRDILACYLSLKRGEK